MNEKDSKRVTPERTCVGCRETLGPESLERFVLMDGQLVHDLRRRAPGRGVWVMARRECLDKALRGGFARGFKARVETPDLEELVEQMSGSIERRLVESLQVAVRARQIVIGQIGVSEGAKRDEVELVIIASDAGQGTRKKFLENARRKRLDVIEDFTGGELGQWLGRDFVSVCGITDGERSARIVQDLKKLSDLGRQKG